jgi:hypothetical protein
MRFCGKCHASSMYGAKFVRRNNKALKQLGYDDLCTVCAGKMEYIPLFKWYRPINIAVELRV